MIRAQIARDHAPPATQKEDRDQPIRRPRSVGVRSRTRPALAQPARPHGDRGAARLDVRRHPQRDDHERRPAGAPDRPAASTPAWASGSPQDSCSRCRWSSRSPVSSSAGCPRGLLFGIAMSLFSAGTLIAALAPDFAVLLVARVVQAGGTAIMLPLLMTTVMTLVPPARRGAVMGNISIVISVAPADRPHRLRRSCSSVLGWRFMFWLVLPIALVALVLGLRRIFDIGERSRTPIDVPSVVLSALGFGGLVYGLSTHRRIGGRHVSGPVWVSFAVGVVGLALFVARQIVLQRTDRALLDLRTFRSRDVHRRHGDDDADDGDPSRHHHPAADLHAERADARAAVHRPAAAAGRPADGPARAGGGSPVRLLRRAGPRSCPAP